EYYKKEALLVDRNQALSKQLETLLLEIEKIILKNSELKSEASKEIIDNVSENIAKTGILLSIIALIFGMIILRDVNKSMRYKKKLEELNMSMKNLVQQKSFLMATISHDMVSPINSLMGFSALLKQHLKTDKPKEYLNNIEKSTQYIKNMVDDLSMFSNLEYNKVKIVNASFNFKELLSGILDNLKENANRKNIELLSDIDEHLNQNFHSDAFRIQQILTNVISNAIKFTHQGSVTVKAHYLKNKVQIEVIDTGIGIKIDHKEELFDEFVQTHDTSETNYGGSGLGLNIAKRLIDLLYGTISFESELGKGTVFNIELPLPVFEKKEVTNTKTVEYDNENKLQNNRILVIDDDPLQLKLLQEIFEKRVKKLTTIEDGKQAKEILQQETYHLIITDMQMPHYSGLKVIQDIRSLTAYEQTPVIALTGKIDFDDSEYQDLGFNLYLKKPLNINTLYNTIYKLLRIKNEDIDSPTHNTSTHQMKYTNFDLTELYRLLDYDQEAVYQILQVFIENAQSDLEQLNLAYRDLNKDEIKNIAHKMLPMFRQLKIEEVIPHLLTLERESDQLTTETLSTEIKLTIEKIKSILDDLGKVINQ
ncbi:MAG TPA: ATP-binding protein, partial [Flavobacterium sp.]|nr:ATP-binding protein [Flavobacterium sp.]